jgi:hypothetical protein
VEESTDPGAEACNFRAISASKFDAPAADLRGIDTGGLPCAGGAMPAAPEKKLVKILRDRWRLRQSDST